MKQFVLPFILLLLFSTCKAQNDADTLLRDMPRRLRLRAGAYSFSDELGLAIEETLEKEDFIIKARSNGENGSLCIEYVPGTREKVLESLRKLNLNRTLRHHLFPNLENGLLSEEALPFGQTRMTQIGRAHV